MIDPNIQFANQLMANYQSAMSDLLNKQIVLQTQLQIAQQKLIEANETIEALRTEAQRQKPNSGKTGKAIITNDDENF